MITVNKLFSFVLSQYFSKEIENTCGECLGELEKAVETLAF